MANVPCPGERGEGAGKWLMYHVWGRGGGGEGAGKWLILYNIRIHD